jgi:hypothetical protein
MNSLAEHECNCGKKAGISALPAHSSIPKAYVPGFHEVLIAIMVQASTPDGQ